MKIAYTVCTASYLAHAKTLADSFIEHNPDYIFYIGLLDRIDERFDEAFFAPHSIVEVAHWQIPYFAEMNERYTVFELSNAMKPYFAAYLLKEYSNAQLLIFLDSDIMVFGSFEHIEQVLQTHSIALTPHILTPIHEDGLSPRESEFLNSGTFNAGFLAIKNDSMGRKFLTWFKEKLRDKCRMRLEEGYFVDQKWLNLVPTLFEGVYYVRHRGYNVAQFNLHERYMSQVDDKFYVNEKEPLVFYHFTGYDLNQPQSISRYQTRFSIDYRTDIKVFLDIYQHSLQNNNASFYTNLPYIYQQIKNVKNAYSQTVEQQALAEQQQQLVQIVSQTVSEAVRLEAEILIQTVKDEVAQIYAQTWTARLRNKMRNIFHQR